MSLTGACVFGQSGGPTAVINASAAGVFTEALAQSCITKVYAAAYGVEGILTEQLYDMSAEDPEEIALLKHTPSSALGSVRHKIKGDKDLRRILEVFIKYNIRYFFYNGGNDSMDTCNKVSKYLQSQNYDCRVIGVCKTIDNDLVGTDHCPGYGSAAKFVATTVMSMYLDAVVYRKGQVTIVETMGRDAGWLTASAALASLKGCGPDLIYLPETTFDRKTFVDEVRGVLKEHQNNNCFIVVSEGVRTADGNLVHAGVARKDDKFGHPKLGGVAAALEEIVKAAFPGVKTRSVELNILQRCSSFVASACDVNEAFEIGRFAVKSAVGGATDKMVAFAREPASVHGETYVVKYVLADIGASANAVKTIPKEWILPGHRGLTKEFIAYLLPLIQGDLTVPFKDGLPKFAHLKKVLVTTAAAPSSL